MKSRTLHPTVNLISNDLNGVGEVKRRKQGGRGDMNSQVTLLQLFVCETRLFVTEEKRRPRSEVPGYSISQLIRHEGEVLAAPPLSPGDTRDNGTVPYCIRNHIIK